jgi:hypothetical protein
MTTVLKSQGCPVGVANVWDLRKARGCGLFYQGPTLMDRIHLALSESRMSVLACGKVSLDLISLLTRIGESLKIESPELGEEVARILQ